MDNQTIALITSATGSLLLGAASMYTSRLYGWMGRYIKSHNNPTEHADTSLANDSCGSNSNAAPSFSIIIVAHNQVGKLQHYLPIFLDQNYDNYEVVVINDASTDETEQVLEQMEITYSNLRHSFVPQSAKYINHTKLALTLGVKSSQNEWIILTKADAFPSSKNWLSLLARQCTPYTDVVTSYTNYEIKDHSESAYLNFEMLFSQMFTLHYASTTAQCYSAHAACLAFRRQRFMENKGYASNTQLMCGEAEILANELSKPGNTQVLIHPDAMVRTEFPFTTLPWKQDELFFMETRRHLHHTFKMRAHYNFFMLTQWSERLFFVACAAGWIILGEWWWAIAFAVWHLLVVAFKMQQLYITTKALGEKSYWCSLDFYECGEVFRKAGLFLRYHFADKSIFNKNR